MDGPREIGVPDEDQIIIPPTTPVNTDDNALPNADASGDSDDERPDENEAVPESSAIRRTTGDTPSGA